MVSGFPAAYRSSGRQSAPAMLWPCRAASAAASCRLSRIGMAGSRTRAGRSPSQACSSRREVSSTLHRVCWARSRSSPARSSCSAGVQALGVPAGNPVTGSTLSQTHSTGSCASTCSTMSRRWPGSVTAARRSRWPPAARRSGRRRCR